MLVRETAAALAAVGSEEAVGLVPACRRLIDRHLTAGPMWWLAARVLTASDPVAEAWGAADDIEHDATAAHLVRHLPDELTVTIVGWPSIVGHALRRRADLEVLVADAGGDGSALAHRLDTEGVDALAVPDAGIAAGAVVRGPVGIAARGGRSPPGV